MTLSHPSATNDAAAEPQPPTPAAPKKERKASRRPAGLFTGPDASDDQQPSPQPPSSPSDPPADQPSASESPDAAGGKKRRRRDAASSSTLSITDRRQLKGAIAAGVELVAVQLHTAAAARDELAGAEGLWLVDEQDKEGIAEPLSSIVARRGGPGVVNPDLGDAIAALIALVTYISKNLNVAARIRGWRKGQPVDEAAAMAQPPQEPAA